MSLQNSLVCFLLKTSQFKKISYLSMDSFIKMVRMVNKCYKAKAVSIDMDLHYKMSYIHKEYECLQIRKGEQKSKRAILCLYGGAFVFNPKYNNVRAAKMISNKTGLDVWFPYYPLALDVKYCDIIAMVFHTYKTMVDEYGPGNVSVIGISSGGMLAMTLCLYNTLKANGALPMPREMVLISPAQFPCNKDEVEQMKRLGKKDVLFDYEFLNKIGMILKTEPTLYGSFGVTDKSVLPTLEKLAIDLTFEAVIDSTVEDWMLYPTRYMTDTFPPVHIYYAEDELLYATWPSFEKAFEKHEIPYRLHTIPKGYHCYAINMFTPEGNEALDKICAFFTRE